MTRYVPILKGKQGEYNALADLAPSTRTWLQPLLEIVPSAEDADPAAQKTDADKVIGKLSKVWAALPAFVDAGHFDLTVDLDGQGLTARACAGLESRSVIAVPVLRLSDPMHVRFDVAALHADFHRGACVRLTRDEDLADDGDAVNAKIDDLLAQTGLSRPDVDLLLDAGPVDGDIDVRTATREIRMLLRELPSLNDYRSVTVAAGAFPQDLSAYEPTVLGERARYDADLWTVLIGRGLPREVDFGDYAIAHPHLSEGGAFRAAPQLRYTTDTSWLILKGRVNDPLGHEQFYDVCAQIAAHPKFAGAALGPSDRRIADSRSFTTGNATTWRQIANAHHMDYVVRRLTTLGEP